MNQGDIDIPRKQIIEFCQKWRIIEFSFFGSVVRDDFNPDSDIDVLVSFADNAPWSLYDWTLMIEELKAIFGREVDLVEKKTLTNPFRRHSILSNRTVIYAT
ncbi:MAG: nucleotidyltransferase domain-containing protein [Deltaproteobacteria bacterium]|nr:nucleotidyltransferase domain-containing protein [Deltaproteobacteria bacterium]